MMRQNHEPQILDDSDDDFDPKTEDINQYCSIIGLDPIKEPDLLWIAKEGILAKLEPPWKAINQADVGLYYFNFETGDSMWEHPNDQYYRQKVKTEREKMKKKSKKEDSPRLAPLRTPRSGTDQSVSNSLDFLKSSNESFKLGQKPVLGAQSLETSSPSDEDSDSRSENIQLDINDLQPAVVIDNNQDKIITEDYSEDPSDSFALGANKFIKKETKKTSSISEVSKSSKSSSKSSKSVSRSKSASKASVSKSTPKSRDSASKPKKLPKPVVEQIDSKRVELTRDIEAEMKKVQMELHAHREERYTEIMSLHEEEILEKQAQRVNAEQEQLKRDEIDKVRCSFESEMEQAVQRENQQHKMTMESALNGLKGLWASHIKEKAAILAAEESKLAAELEQLKLTESQKFEDKKSQLKRQLEDEEKKSLEKMEENLLAKKHENERVIEQDKRMFDILREERAKLEKRNKDELIKLQEEHNARRQRLLSQNNVEIRELEQAHVTKMSNLHLTFETELTTKRKMLEAKRAEFDQRINKWESNHVKNKMAWAESSVKRINEHEEDIHKQSVQLNSERTSSPLKNADDALTRQDLDKSGSSATTEQPKHTNQATPASERLRQYLKGLEKKLENVTTMIDHHSPTQSKGHSTNVGLASTTEYVSDRWRAYYGTDFKYVPAKKELDDRAANDYRYKSRDMVRTSSY